MLGEDICLRSQVKQVYIQRSLRSIHCYMCHDGMETTRSKTSVRLMPRFIQPLIALVEVIFNDFPMCTPYILGVIFTFYLCAV